ncbi:hypothetical protein QQF64_024749 [Cirrhinus molitorella]|uniref:Uncharacterized protein n=1 Tax=Cirrhinus molitorella TaxID=172907 RepID=A0ABR3NN33_9TELE
METSEASLAITQRTLTLCRTSIALDDLQPRGAVQITEAIPQLTASAFSRSALTTQLSVEKGTNSRSTPTTLRALALSVRMKKSSQAVCVLKGECATLALVIGVKRC